jgi:hypothetical protein
LGMKPCKECGKEVSTSAKTCPNCGKKYPSGGLTGPAKIFLGIILFLVLISFIGRCGQNSVPKDIKITQNVAVNEITKYYQQVPIGGGWTIAGCRAEGTAVKVKVLIPQASEIMADPIEKQQKTLSTVCCPGDKEPLWKAIEGYRIVIEASTPNGDIFSNVDCPQYAASVVAQKTEPKISIPSNQFPPKKKYNHKYKITTEYRKKDKFDGSGDYTSVGLDFNNLNGTFKLNTSFIYDGKVIKTPDIVTLYFSCFHNNKAYSSDSVLMLLIDDLKLTFIKPKYYVKEVSIGVLHESMFFDIPIQTYLNIVNAKSVEGKLGDSEFKLKNTQLEALRDFASRMQ